jgi:hypothetical protein
MIGDLIVTVDIKESSAKFKQREEMFIQFYAKIVRLKWA